MYDHGNEHYESALSNIPGSPGEAVTRTLIIQKMMPLYIHGYYSQLDPQLAVSPLFL